MSQPSMDPGSIAIVEDEPELRRLMRLWLEADGYSVIEYAGGREAAENASGGTAIVCLDLQLEDMPGQDVLKRLRARDPELPVIVVTGDQDLDTAALAMRAGAYDFVTKPFDRERLQQAVRRAMERRQLTASVQRLRSELGERAVVSSIIGSSSPMRELTAQVERVLESDVAVVLVGESGTGKELVARAIHSGRRKNGPFVTVNCAAIPEALQESELFGHERGAESGAMGSHAGRFEQANGGTLFLNEIGEISAATQASLARALEDRAVRRVGGSAEIPVDARIICATHRDLEAMVRAGRFREDLYFRIAVYPIRLPPLRARADDIPALVAHFLRAFSEDVGREIERVSAEALDALMRYAWPGNVRELQNVVHRAMLACDGDGIKLAHLPSHIQGAAFVEGASEAMDDVGSASDHEGPVLDGTTLNLREIEREAISRALKLAGGSVGKAAKILGIGRATLYRRLSEQRSPLGSDEPSKLNGHGAARP